MSKELLAGIVNEQQMEIYAEAIEKLQAELKAKDGLIESLLRKPASIECPKCHIHLKAV